MNTLQFYWDRKTTENKTSLCHGLTQVFSYMTDLSAVQFDAN